MCISEVPAEVPGFTSFAQLCLDLLRVMFCFIIRGTRNLKYHTVGNFAIFFTFLPGFFSNFCSKHVPQWDHFWRTFEYFSEWISIRLLRCSLRLTLLCGITHNDLAAQRAGPLHRQCGAQPLACFPGPRPPEDTLLHELMGYCASHVSKEGLLGPAGDLGLPRSSYIGGGTAALDDCDRGFAPLHRENLGVTPCLSHQVW